MIITSHCDDHCGLAEVITNHCDDFCVLAEVITIGFLEPKQSKQKVHSIEEVLTVGCDDFCGLAVMVARRSNLGRLAGMLKPNWVRWLGRPGLVGTG